MTNRTGSVAAVLTIALAIGCSGARAESVARTTTPARATVARANVATVAKEKPPEEIDYAQVFDEWVDLPQRGVEVVLVSETLPSREWSERLISPAAITNANAPAMTVGMTFEGGSFVIEGVPPGVTFHRVGRAPPTWEIRDATGQRLALVQEEEWRYVMRPESGTGITAPVDAASAGEVIEVARWRDGPATIVAEQIWGELHLYRIERLAEGTDWIAIGFRPVESAYETASR